MADDSGLEEVLGQAIKAAADVIRGLPDHTLLEMARASVVRGGPVSAPSPPRASGPAGGGPKKEVAKSAPRPTVNAELSPKAQRTAARLARIVEHLRKAKEPLTSSEVAQALKLVPLTTRKDMRALAAEKRLTATGSGRLVKYAPRGT